MPGPLLRLWGWWRRLFRADPRTANQRTGARAESLAADYLRAKGFDVLERNLRVGRDEADLICRAPGGTFFVLVEVKAKTPTRGRGSAIPADARIDRRKRNALRRLRAYLMRSRGWPAVRVDVVTVEFTDPPTIRHFAGQGL
ncbi:MAG: YraN family protein [Planctomycetota bacterium]|nr:YraN family protein [Planctomycetota bacterium]